MTPSRPLVRLTAAVALLALLVAPSAASAPQAQAKRLLPPTNFHVAALSPFSATLAWDPAPNSGSFVYSIRDLVSTYSVGVAQTETTYKWTRDMKPGRTYTFALRAADRRGTSEEVTLTVTLPVDTTPPSSPLVSLTDLTHSSASIQWAPPTDDDYTCCTYRVYANGWPVYTVWTGPTSAKVKLAPAKTYSLTVVATDPSKNSSAPSAPLSVTTPASTDTTPPSAPPGLQAFAIDACETWLSWGDSTDNADPPDWITYEIRVNGVFDGAQVDNAQWITYGNVTGTNTFTVQAIDSSGNRSAISSVPVDGLFC
jgi:hypothetical protein